MKRLGQNLLAFIVVVDVALGLPMLAAMFYLQNIGDTADSAVLANIATAIVGFSIVGIYAAWNIQRRHS